ncbi:Crp/Fnr family transcriptional regulator [Actinoplanes auranticolor]|uniref:Crp/Fnr family transcriptional regulator n=1 Tax=Actinoplanes auranticolor TaxID=47988 RepID=A0A919VL09_9ACTN|nr:Crp/Fnr family transcriptional regulator [Actinoplanes auranticolor]GIM67010.1 Crp/Fnr family transcriptional regulator [Actinoplanes auranticolor]
MVDPVVRQNAGWAPGTLLGSLGPAAAMELVALGVRRQFPPGRLIIRQGGRDSHVVVLISGFVKVTTAVEGVETLLGIRLPGEVIGEISALTGDLRSATVTACGRVGAGLVAGRDFAAFLRRRPEAATLVTAMVARQLNWANRRRTDFAAFPAHIRLARLLIEIAEVCGRDRPDGGIDIAVPLSQPELAAMIAIAQATVQKAVHELRDRKLISTGYRRITVTDPAGLRALADGLA